MSLKKKNPVRLMYTVEVKMLMKCGKVSALLASRLALAVKVINADECDLIILSEMMSDLVLA